MEQETLKQENPNRSADQVEQSKTKPVPLEPDFLSTLQEKLESRPPKRKKEKKMLAWLKAPPSQERDKHLSNMQVKAKRHMKAKPDEKVKWARLTEVDWDGIIQMLIEYLMKILPFIFV